MNKLLDQADKDGQHQNVVQGERLEGSEVDELNRNLIKMEPQQDSSLFATPLSYDEDEHLMHIKNEVR